MKSGEHRDRLVQSEGVIGFEMEGAGVWDNISYIIIKGVCDYADNHKNKAWQSYAAATGAAAAKVFLEYWEPTVREEVHKFHIPLDLSAVPAIEEFIGREEELDRLWDYLQPRSSHRRVAVLHGLGGIGKTQLAIHFASKHQNEFTAIFWLSGKDQSALILSLSSCLPRILGHPVNNRAKDEEAEQRASQELQWLAAPGNNRWLIIFDNIDQYALLPDCNTCGYDIREFFPTADHGSIIITSRVQGNIKVGKPFPIGKLTQKDATQLLLQSSGFSNQGVTQGEFQQDIISLVNQLDGLSLAIVLAGAFMRETSTGIRDYLQFYRSSWPALQSQAVPTRHYQQGNILETWMITYQEIRKRDPTAAALLLLLACFDNRDVWYELIQGGRNCSYTPPWFKMVVSNKLAFKTAIKMLTVFSLVETKQHEGSYTIHPVVQDWCLYIAALEECIVQLSELALVSIGYMVPTQSNRDYASLQQRLLPHAKFLIQRERYNWPDDKIAVWEAFNGLGNLYRNLGKLKEAEGMYQRALAGREKALGPDHTSTLDSVNSLGILYRSQGKLKEAEEMYQRALAGYEKALGPGHSKTRMVSKSLASLATFVGKRPRKRDTLYTILRRK
ncbi:P-loop containing nucleoside triphosphate hydrolase protein [Aspergillus germanicus]